jgi:hypothetical protein
MAFWPISFSGWIEGATQLEGYYSLRVFSWTQKLWFILVFKARWHFLSFVAIYAACAGGGCLLAIVVGLPNSHL